MGYPFNRICSDAANCRHQSCGNPDGLPGRGQPTNNITPTFAYLGIILTYAQKYDRRAQTGTVIAYMLPFSISFTIVWVGLLIIWTLLGLPIGPGYHVFL